LTLSTDPSTEDIGGAGPSDGQAMLVDGNDLRGIDVGLFCTAAIEVRWIRSHAAGWVWVFSLGWNIMCRASWPPTGRSPTGPTRRPKEHLGGFAVVDVPSREEALEWSAKIAAACRCEREVFELLPDPTV
jgi:hypothetical protein